MNNPFDLPAPPLNRKERMDRIMVELDFHRNQVKYFEELLKELNEQTTSTTGSVDRFTTKGS